MIVFITGATGLVGRRLVADRLRRGDRVRVLSRSADRAAKVFADADPDCLEVVEGDPTRPGAWCDRISGCDGVVHLAGAGILDRRWTAAYKRELIRSRVDSAKCVVDAMRAADDPPSVLVSSSAIGWYGDGGDRELDEDATPTTPDFMTELVRRWEDEVVRWDSDGTRAVSVRTGIVLDPRGGMLGTLLRPFRMFVGGPMMPGTQYVSWIHWQDLVGVFDLALANGRAQGPINGTAPHPVTMREFCRALGRALHRPSWLPVPTFAMRLALGEVAPYIGMSARVIPRRAQELGFEFRYPEIDAALTSLLGPA